MNRRLMQGFMGGGEHAMVAEGGVACEFAMCKEF